MEQEPKDPNQTGSYRVRATGTYKNAAPKIKKDTPQGSHRTVILLAVGCVVLLGLIIVSFIFLPQMLTQGPVNGTPKPSAVPKNSPIVIPSPTPTEEVQFATLPPSPSPVGATPVPTESGYFPMNNYLLMVTGTNQSTMMMPPVQRLQISFMLQETAEVYIEVRDIFGDYKEVVLMDFSDGAKKSGMYTLYWDGKAGDGKYYRTCFQVRVFVRRNAVQPDTEYQRMENIVAVNPPATPTPKPTPSPTPTPTLIPIPTPTPTITLTP